MIIILYYVDVVANTLYIICNSIGERWELLKSFRDIGINLLYIVCYLTVELSGLLMRNAIVNWLHIICNVKIEVLRPLKEASLMFIR